jgi:hypothetical protein
MKEFAAKALGKIRIRYNAFKALLPALLKLDRFRNRPTRCNLEHFLNLIRLSFLSMPTYVLRTLNPLYCVAYSEIATDLSIDLIHSVFPAFVELPPSQQVNLLEYPDLNAISSRIMQLPLTLGGLSLRLPNSIADIAYAASATDCLPCLRAVARRLHIPFDYALVPNLLNTRSRIHAALPSVDANFWHEIENPELNEDKDSNDVPLQHQITKILNSSEIRAIAQLLQPWPIYYQAFKARTDKEQDHVSWPLNPKTRAFHRIPMLSDAEFSRSIAIATLYPIMAPRICTCGHPIDPAGFHLLHCHFNHYGYLHDNLKFAVERSLRSFLSSSTAAVSVAVEQPMNSLFPLRDLAACEGTALIADLVVFLHGDLQQEPVACDFVSCFFHTYGDWRTSLAKAVRFKTRKYLKYNCPPNSFYPLSFGRTNVFSPEILRFCAHVGSYFPPQLRVQHKLRAVFSRAIYAGTAQLHSTAIRRLQLAVSRARSVASIPLAAVLFPLCDEFHAASARGNTNSRASVIGRHALLPQPAALLSRVSSSRRVYSGGA